MLYTEGDAKGTDLFLKLLEAVERRYPRRFRRLYVVLDNYGIHSSRIARLWLAYHPQIRLLFQPAYLIAAIASAAYTRWTPAPSVLSPLEL